MYNVLFGLLINDKSDLRKFAGALEKHGVQINAYECKESKEEIVENLKSNKDTNIVIVSEYLQSDSPYTTMDYIYIMDSCEDVILIPILLDEHKGDEYVKELYQIGLYNALYQEDATFEKVAQMILNNRNRKEAKNYYGLPHTVLDNIGADIEKCREYIIMAEESEKRKDNVNFIKENVTEEEFALVLSGLPKDIKNELRLLEVFIPYLNEKENLRKDTVFEKENTVIKEYPESKAIAPKEEEPSLKPILKKEVTEEKIKAKPVTNKVDLTKIVTDVIIGFAGAQRRVGTTHQAVTAAYFLSVNKFRVALIESGKSQSKSFDAIARLHNVQNDNDYFSHNGVDYYKEFDLLKLGSLINQGYNFIIIDYGLYHSSIRSDFERCTKQIVVLGAGGWEKNMLNKFMSENVTFQEGVNYNYLIQGIPEEECDTFKKLNHTVENQYFTEYQTNPFNGKGNRALRNLFGYYVSSDTEERERREAFKNLFSFSSALKLKEFKSPVEKYSMERRKIQYRGTAAIFITSLKHGTGCTHLGVSVSNYFTQSGMGSVCCINQNSRVLKSRLDSSVYRIEDMDSYDEIYSGYNYLVFDRGIISELSMNELTELKRADYKIMMCVADDDYLDRLAQFVRSYGAGSREWIYIFNILPKGKEKDIQKLMQGYKFYCLPLFDSDGAPTKSVKSIYLELF